MALKNPYHWKRVTLLDPEYDKDDIESLIDMQRGHGRAEPKLTQERRRREGYGELDFS